MIRVPIQPILDHIHNTFGRADTDGTFALFFPQEEVWIETLVKSEDEWGGLPLGSEGYLRTRVHPEHVREFKKQQKRIERARERGWIDYFQADEICVDVFGKHPFQVYGQEWFSIPDDKKLQDRLAGLTTTKEEAAA